jgi:dienelactone hydrolase
MKRTAALLVAVASLAAIVAAVWQLEAATRGVTIERAMIDATPLTVFRPAQAARDAPVAVIAHGFAGSQQLMQPLAVTLARNGHVAVTFDFPGHGRSGAPMPARGADWDARQRVLADALDAVGAYARDRLASERRYAVVGHSMASDLIVRHAQGTPAVSATVAISAFAPTITAATPHDSPRNLLVIVGALEPAVLRDEALRLTRPDDPAQARLATTSGDFAAGTARRAVFAPGVEHIGVLYGAATLGATLAWLDAAAGRAPAIAPFLDVRGPWLALLLAGIIGLAWPLSHLLPQVGHLAPPRLTRRAFWTIALVPMIVTPLVLWRVPTGFMPVLLAGYLLLHFALYGALTFAMTAWRIRGQSRPRDALPHHGFAALALAAVATTGYVLLAVGLPLDRYVFNVQPAPGRWPYVVLMVAGTALYFAADERLVRADGVPRYAYAATKACFLVSLAIATVLDLSEMFFLVIIVPAILLLFVVYGLFSGWAWRRARHWAVPAIASAIAFAWFVAVTFPRVG